MSELAARAPPRVVVCIGALPSGGQASHARHLCKRLRARFPDLKILVGRWGLTESTEEIRELVRASGADHVGTTLVETREQIQQVSHLESMTSTDPAAGGALSRTGTV